MTLRLFTDTNTSTACNVLKVPAFDNWAILLHFHKQYYERSNVPIVYQRLYVTFISSQSGLSEPSVNGHLDLYLLKNIGFIIILC